MARNFERQVAEIQIRIAVLNHYTALGIPVTEAVAKSVWEQGKLRPICATKPSGVTRLRNTVRTRRYTGDGRGRARKASSPKR
jgi:hypothetical protein